MLGNHDQPRIATRVGARQARVAAMLLLTLPGTLTLYYGEELGMTNVPIPPEQVQDPAEKNEPGLGQGRDPERTPMLWDASRSAGFTTGSPWLPLGDDHAASTSKNSSTTRPRSSSLSPVDRLRRTHPALVSGKLQAASQLTNTCSAFSEKEKTNVSWCCSISATTLSRFQSRTPAVVISTYLDRDSQSVNGSLDIRPAEGIVLRLYDSL